MVAGPAGTGGSREPRTVGQGRCPSIPARFALNSPETAALRPNPISRRLRSWWEAYGSVIRPGDGITVNISAVSRYGSGPVIRSTQLWHGRGRDAAERQVPNGRATERNPGKSERRVNG